MMIQYTAAGSKLQFFSTQNRIAVSARATFFSFRRKAPGKMFQTGIIFANRAHTIYHKDIWRFLPWKVLPEPAAEAGRKTKSRSCARRFAARAGLGSRFAAFSNKSALRSAASPTACATTTTPASSARKREVPHAAPFQTFTQDEVRQLVHDVLAARAQGVSRARLRAAHGGRQSQKYAPLPEQIPQRPQNAPGARPSGDRGHARQRRGDVRSLTPRRARRRSRCTTASRCARIPPAIRRS